ncbi:hypothetical protein FACS1894104_4320 [Actinomycetota bacterium]|nr:hypothetical protein FACS1894104_4320 [Actinomycetota bacterium]
METNVIKQGLAPLAFIIATLVFVLFALGVITLPLVQVNNQLDQHGDSYTGAQNTTNAQFVGPVQIVFANNEIYQGEFAKNRFNGAGKFSGVEPLSAEESAALAAGQGASHGAGQGASHGAGQSASQDANQTAAAAVVTERAATWTIEGNFVNGRLVGAGSYADSEGSYSGNFENSMPHGQGVYTSNAGWRYEGNFTMGSMTGHGTVYTAEGETLKGQWQSGVLLD